MNKRSNPEEDRESNAPTTPKRFRQTNLSNTLTPTTPALSPNATISSAIEDRKSKFIGYFIPCSTPSSLAHTKSLLRDLPDLVHADHKIMAWNVGQSTGFDDDGEK